MSALASVIRNKLITSLYLMTLQLTCIHWVILTIKSTEE